MGKGRNNMAVKKIQVTHILNPPVRYLTQRDNINPFTLKPDGHNQCMVASFTMLMNWLGDRLNVPHLKNYQERLHLNLVGKNEYELEARRYNSNNHALVCNQQLEALKLPQRFVSRDCNYDQMLALYEQKKSPIIVGSMITKCGHIIIYIGGAWHDPYGKADERSNGYYDHNGAGVKYSDSFCRNNIFRLLDGKGNTIKTNAPRRCWYIEGVA